MSKRNSKCSAFFQRLRDSFIVEDDTIKTWCQNKPLGKNTLGKMMIILSKAAKLSYVYTNHCVRATATTALSHTGFEARHIMTVLGHSHESSVRSYVSDTTAIQKRNMSEALSDITAASSYTHQRDDVFNDGMDDGMDDAFVFSLSQTEQILKTIASYEGSMPFSGRSEFDSNQSVGTVTVAASPVIQNIPLN